MSFVYSKFTATNTLMIRTNCGACTAALFRTNDNTFAFNYNSPLFAHRKRSSKLRLFIFLRQRNHSTKTDCTSSKFRCINPSSDVSTHFTEKILFTKLICSQAYERADDFTSSSWLLVLGRTKSVNQISFFNRDYLRPCLAADLCKQLEMKVTAFES